MRTITHNFKKSAAFFIAALFVSISYVSAIEVTFTAWTTGSLSSSAEYTGIANKNLVTQITVLPSNSSTMVNINDVTAIKNDFPNLAVLDMSGVEYATTSFTQIFGTGLAGGYKETNTSKLQSISLPFNITTLQAGTNPAFKNCQELTTVVLPAGFTTIGWFSFYNCPKLTNINLQSTAMSSSTNNGANIFRDCTGLKSIVLPDALTTIPGSMFNGCTSLETVTLPNAASIQLMANAFTNCTSISTIISRSTTVPAFSGPKPEDTPNFLPWTNYKTCKVYVPASAIAAYQASTDEIWAKFPDANIYSLEDLDAELRSFLFIGNSFTMRHELPTVFAKLAKEGNPGTLIQTEIVGYGGRNLFQHWECFRSYDRLLLNTQSEADRSKSIQQLDSLFNCEEEPAFYTTFWNELNANALYAKSKLKNSKNWDYDRQLIQDAIIKHNNWIKNASITPTKFDYVVLQGWLDVTDDAQTGYFKYAAKFAEVAEINNGIPVLYLTAPYSQNQTPVSQAVAREQVVDECIAAQNFAKSINAIVVPVPLALAFAQESTEAVARTLTFRYNSDFHPNNTMGYLTACTFYAAVYGKSPEGLLFNKVSEQSGTNIHGEVVNVNDTTNIALLKDPDGGPIETIFTDEERIFLQRTAWKAVEALRSGNLTGINALEATNSDLSPKIVEDYLILENTENVQHLELISLSGQVLKTFHPSMSAYSLKNVTTGVYLVRVTYNSHVKTFRLIKK